MGPLHCQRHPWFDSWHHRWVFCRQTPQQPHVSIYLSIYLFIHLCLQNCSCLMCMSVHLFIRLYIRLSIDLSICQSIGPFHQQIYPYLNLPLNPPPQNLRPRPLQGTGTSAGRQQSSQRHTECASSPSGGVLNSRTR